MNRTERLTAILLLLQETQQNPLTAAQIARHFELSRRTVLRDMQALSEMGVPVIAREGPGGGYTLPASYTLEPLALNSSESFLLLLALNTINRLSDAPFAAERASLAAKLRSLLPHAQLSDLDRLLAKVAVATPDRPQRAPFLDAIIHAVKEDRWLKLSYQSPERVSLVHILPRDVYSQDGYWYCRAYIAEKGREQTYRVDRILALDPPAEDFQPLAPVEPLPYDHPSHPEIRASLSARGARVVEVEADIASNLRQHADGSAFLAFRCPPSELDYFARYFAGLGADIHVDAPPELCDKMAAIGRGLVESYASKKQ